MCDPGIVMPSPAAIGIDERSRIPASSFDAGSLSDALSRSTGPVTRRRRDATDLRRVRPVAAFFC